MNTNKINNVNIKQLLPPPLLILLRDS